MADRYDPDMLLGYLEDDLTDEQRADFEALLERDPALCELVGAMAEDRAALRDLPQVEPPDDLVDDALARTERQMLLGNPADEPMSAEQRMRRFRLGRVLVYSGLAAVVLLSGAAIVATLFESPALLNQKYGPLALKQQKHQQPSSAADSSATGRSDAKSSAEPAAGGGGSGAVTPLASADALAKDAMPPENAKPPTLASNDARPIPAAPESAASPEPLETPQIAAGHTTLTDTFRGRTMALSQQLSVAEAPASAASATPPAETLAQRRFAARPVEGANGAAAPPVVGATGGAAMATRSAMTPPTVEVRVQAAQMAGARQQIQQWARRHDVAVDVPAGPPAAFAGAKPHAAAAPALDKSLLMRQRRQATDLAPAETQLTLALNREQLPHLLRELNAEPGQTAAIVAPPASSVLGASRLAANHPRSGARLEQPQISQMTQKVAAASQPFSGSGEAARSDANRAQGSKLKAIAATQPDAMDAGPAPATQPAPPELDWGAVLRPFVPLMPTQAVAPAPESQRIVVHVTLTPAPATTQPK